MKAFSLVIGGVLLGCGQPAPPPAPAAPSTPASVAPDSSWGPLANPPAETAPPASSPPPPAPAPASAPAPKARWNAVALDKRQPELMSVSLSASCKKKDDDCVAKMTTLEGSLACCNPST